MITLEGRPRPARADLSQCPVDVAPLRIHLVAMDISSSPVVAVPGGPLGAPGCLVSHRQNKLPS